MRTVVGGRVLRMRVDLFRGGARRVSLWGRFPTICLTAAVGYCSQFEQSIVCSYDTPKTAVYNLLHPRNNYSQVTVIK